MSISSSLIFRLCQSFTSLLISLFFNNPCLLRQYLSLLRQSCLSTSVIFGYISHLYQCLFFVNFSHFLCQFAFFFNPCIPFSQWVFVYFSPYFPLFLCQQSVFSASISLLRQSLSISLIYLFLLPIFLFIDFSFLKFCLHRQYFSSSSVLHFSINISQLRQYFSSLSISLLCQFLFFITLFLLHRTHLLQSISSTLICLFFPCFNLFFLYFPFSSQSRKIFFLNFSYLSISLLCRRDFSLLRQSLSFSAISCLSISASPNYLLLINFSLLGIALFFAILALLY